MKTVSTTCCSPYVGAAEKIPKSVAVIPDAKSRCQYLNVYDNILRRWLSITIKVLLKGADQDGT